MTQLVAPLSAASEQALRRAVQSLESRHLAARLAEYASQPVDRILRFMPRAANEKLNSVVHNTMLNCLELAIQSVPHDRAPPKRWVSSLMAGITGGIGGAFGLVALPLELPVTTTMILRSIARIARAEGEDLSKIPARLACMEVFALGGNRVQDRFDVGYYAARALLSRLMNESAVLLIERGAAGMTAPIVTGFITEISSRFGVVVSERAAAGAVPVLGALGGATVNALFMDHFQRLAQGHFTVRRLERQYGPQIIQHHYARFSKQSGDAAS